MHKIQTNLPISIDKAIKEDKVNESGSGSEDDLTGEESEPEINPVY